MASCCSGGFYFTTIKYIKNYYSYGVNLRKISLPISDDDFQIVKDPSGNKWRANKIILEEKYSLFDFEVYKLFGLDITKNDYIVDAASKYGRIDFLTKWKSSAIKLVYSNKAMDDASENGHIDVLNWWMSSGFEIKYSMSAMDYASQNGHINVLDWWIASGLEIKYSHNAMDLASYNGKIDILNWWIKSTDRTFFNLPIVTMQASSQGTRWMKSGLKLKYIDCMSRASENNHVDALNWWINSELLFEYETGPVFFASVKGHIDVLDWWKQSGLEFKYNECAINEASANGHIDVLDWWLRSGFKLAYNQYAMNDASANGHINVLQWWVDSGLELKYTVDAITNAQDNNHDNVVSWWNNFNNLGSKKRKIQTDDINNKKIKIF
jgi:ankyrin repeat protein